MSAAAPAPAGPGHDSGAAGPRSLRKNTVFAVGGMGLFQAAQFAVIVLLAKFAPDDVLGQVIYSLAVATPVIMFCSLELRGALVADAAGEFTFGTYRALRSLTMLLAGVALLGLSLWEYGVDGRIAYAVIFAGMCASKIVLSLAEVNWGLFQKREQLDLMAQSLILRGVAMLVAFGVFVPLYHWLQQRGLISLDQVAQGAAIAVAVYVLASTGLLVWFDHRRVAARCDFDAGWTWSAVGRLARQTFPLGLVLLLLHLCDSIPRLAIEQQPDGRVALAHFGALANVTLVGNLVVFQAANAAANRLAHGYQTDFAAFGRLAARLLGMAGAVGVGMLLVTLLLGEWLLRILYRAEYAAYYPEFRIIMVAQCLALLTNVFGVLTMQMRLFWLQVPAQVIVLASTIIAAWTLIPTAANPVRGGAWTIFVRCAVHVTLYAGCVLVGILLRPRLLRGRFRLAPPPAAPGPDAPDTLPNW